MKDEDKQRLAGQLLQLDEAYPGGLLQYVRNARRLLRDSREGATSHIGRNGTCDVPSLSTHISVQMDKRCVCYSLLVAAGLMTWRKIARREERIRRVRAQRARGGEAGLWQRPLQ